MSGISLDDSPRTGDDAALMKICLIVNPNAGKKQGLEVADTVSGLLREAGIHTESLVSPHPGGTREIAEALDLEHWNGVVAVGGDGTLFEVINGLFSASGSLTVPVGQIPVGTGNSFSKDLEIHSVEDAVALIVQGKVTGIQHQ